MCRHLRLAAGFVLAAPLGCGRGGFVLRPVALEATPGVVRVNADVGETLPPVVVSLVDQNGNVAPWRAVSSAPWLQISPREGSTPSEVRLSLATRGLAPGRHRAGITFEIVGASDEDRGVGLVVELDVRAPGWTALDGPYCGDVRSIAVDPNDPNRVLAGNRGGDIFVSGDGGQSFGRFDLDSAGAVSDIVLLPSGRAYAGAKGFYRSDDRGSTWTLVGLSNLAIQTIAVDPADDDVVVVNGGGLWRTRDAGQTWAQVGAGTATYFVRNHPAPGRFAVGGNAGVLYTTDGGAGSGLTPLPPTDIQTEQVFSFTATASGRWLISQDADSNIPPHLRVSDDAGTTWQTVAGAGRPDREDGRWFILQALGDTVWALHSELYRTIDGGETFELIARDFSDYRNAFRHHGLAVHPGGIMLAHETHGVVRVENDRLVQLPVFGCTIEDVRVDVGSGDLVGVFRDHGVFRRRGTTFEGLGTATICGDDYYEVALDPRNANVMLVGTNNCGLKTTRDGGQTWQTNAPGLPLEDADVVRFARDDPDVIWIAAGDEGLYRSGDNGVSYAQASARQAYTLAVVSSTLVFFSSALNDIVRLDLAGAGESVIMNANGSVEHMQATADGSIWLAAGDVRRSTDGGQTFVSLGLAGSSTHDLAIDPAAPSHIFVANSGGLFESTDNGVTWVDAGAPFGPRSIEWDAGSATLYVGTFRGGIYAYNP